MITNPAGPHQSIGGAAPQTLTLNVIWDARDEAYYQEFLKKVSLDSLVLPSSRQQFICYVYNARMEPEAKVALDGLNARMEEPEVQASQYEEEWL